MKRDELFKRSTLLLLGLLMAAGLALRVYHLDAESFWQDEVTIARLVASDPGILVEQTLNGRPPVFTALVYGWGQAFGTSEIALRSLNVVLGVAGLLALYVVAQQLFRDERLALLATAFMTFSGYQVFFAQDVRYYPLLMLLTLLSYGFLWQSLRKGGWLNWLLYIFFAVLTFYTHTHGVFVLLAQGLFALTQWFVYKPARWSWVASQILIVLAISPQMIRLLAGVVPGLVQPIYSLLGQDIATAQATGGGAFGTDWLQLPQATWLVRDVYRMFFYGYVLWAFALVAVVFVLGMAWHIRRRGLGTWLADLRALPRSISVFLRTHHSALLLVLTWFLIPLLVPFVGSFAIGPMYILRYVMTASLALYILVAVVGTLAQRLVPTWLLIASFLILALSSLQIEYYAATTKEQWREIAASVEEQVEDGDAVLVPTHNRPTATVAAAYGWYHSADAPLCQLKVELIEENDADERAAYEDCTADADRIWLVLFEGGNFVTDFEEMTAFLEAEGYTLADDPQQFYEGKLALFVPADA